MKVAAQGNTALNTLKKYDTYCVLLNTKVQIVDKYLNITNLRSK